MKLQQKSRNFIFSLVEIVGIAELSTWVDKNSIVLS